MRISAAVGYALSASVAIAILAGCSSVSSQTAAIPATTLQGSGVKQAPNTLGDNESRRARVKEFQLPADSYPYGITAGPDHSLWFIEQGANNVARITTKGVITDFPVPTRVVIPRSSQLAPIASCGSLSSLVIKSRV